MKIDFHVHSKEYSPCGVSTIDEQIEAAIAAGLDALAFSNHDRLVPLDRLKRLNDRYAPFRILTGIEVTVIGGEHILVLGLHDLRLEGGQWPYPDLHAFVRDKGAFMVLNHPFRFNPKIEIDYRRFPPDAVEAYSSNILNSLRSRSLEVAEEIGVPVVSNSDAHILKDIGRNYNQLTQRPATDEELFRMMKAGRFTPVQQNVLDK